MRDFDRATKTHRKGSIYLAHSRTLLENKETVTQMFQSVILCIYAAVVCRVSALPENFVFALKFARKMEADILEILLCHLENVSRVG